MEFHVERGTDGAGAHMEKVDIEFLIGCMLSLIIVITTLMVSTVVESRYLSDYSQTYAVLTFATLIGCFIYVSVYKYSWGAAGFQKALAGTIITTFALIVTVSTFSAATQTQAMGIPYIPEFEVPEKIPVEIEMTPSWSIARGYINLATIFGIPVNVLISAVLMFPSGFSESIFQTALPRLFKSMFGETLTGEIVGVALSQLIFGGLHYITYGFDIVVFAGTFAGGMAMNLAYRIHKSEIGLALGHTLYNLIVLALTTPVRGM